MRIVFMGTPDFAACSLKKLIDSPHDVVGVFTRPDRPRGRGISLACTPVKELAMAHSIPVFQPERLRGGSAREDIASLAPEVIVVVAYGCILPDDILALPPLGCVNVHASLLPQLRGSSPVQEAVLRGFKTTGVTTMYMASELDAGDIIFQDETEIGEFETSGELFDRLMLMGAETLAKTLNAIENGAAPRTPQQADKATFTKQLTKAMSPIDWQKTPREIVKKICGLQPWPVATAELNGQTVRVFAAQYTENRTAKAAGSVVSAGKEGVEIACGGGQTLLITELQSAGKRRMAAADWLRGHPIAVD
ncbi:MAG: methionyl-tRNA formyltransferase [Oscillospiraceae bacterium]|nr:methionyl-tRNA formyltransferase [Oscillospiraceae bacterium]